MIRVTDFTETPHVERELVLIKVAADERTRGELMNIVDIFRGKIIDVSPQSYIVEVTGAEDKIAAHDRAAAAASASPRSCAPGRVAMFRGTATLTIDDDEDKEKVA